MKIAIGADHGGYKLKQKIIKFLEKQGHIIADLGTHTNKRCDYPEIGAKVARAVSQGLFQRGILVCKTGIAYSIVANKFPRVRAALCLNLAMASASREHNAANILVLGARFTSGKPAEKIIQTWLGTGFNGGRHIRRIRQIYNLERKLMKPKLTERK